MLALEAIPFLKVNWEYRAYIAIIVGFAGSDFFDKHFKSFGLTSSSLGAPMIGQPQESSSISPRQQKALDYIRSSGSINNDQYKELNKVSDRTAVRDMQDLKDKGKVKTQGKGRNVKYVLP